MISQHGQHKLSIGNTGERRPFFRASLPEEEERRNPWDDKSGFLRRAGFALENCTELRAAIRKIATSLEATEDGVNEYGTFYRVDGVLVGPAASLPVTLIWMRRAADGRFHLVTLKPRKE